MDNEILTKILQERTIGRYPYIVSYPHREFWPKGKCYDLLQNRHNHPTYLRVVIFIIDPAVEIWVYYRDLTSGPRHVLEYADPNFLDRFDKLVDYYLAPF